MAEENMEIIDNPFEKHQELLAHLMLSHMSSFSVMTYLTSMLGHTHILSSEAFGTLNERQRESLNVVINNTERLQEHLGVFITTTRLMFTPDRIYEIDCNILSIIDDFIKRTQKTTDFQIKAKLPENIPVFKADNNLIHHEIDCIGRIIKQIHPTHKGQVAIVAEVEGDFIKIIFSTKKDESIYPSNQNLDLFIAQAVAKLHSGEFMIDTSDEVNVNLILTLSMIALS
jgi:K+-sensing histidine kinase KdpD